jgi:hypothetical protein
MNLRLQKRNDKGDILLEQDENLYTVRVELVGDVAKIYRKFRCRRLALKYFNSLEGFPIKGGL